MSYWNCPHCGVSLSLGDQELGSDWSFLRCYKCSGHSLIRISESNLIRVQQAPTGQAILEGRKPEAAQTKKSRKRTIPVAPDLTKVPIHQSAPVAAPISVSGNLAPQQPVVSKQGRFIPFLMGLTSALAVISGGYLYSQSQQLYERLEYSEAAPDRPAPTSPASEDAPSAPIPDSLKGKAEAPVIADAGSGMATSCIVKTSDYKTSDSTILIRVRNGTAKLRSGPGLEYPVSMSAGTDWVLEVHEWEGRWFKVRARNAAPREGRGLASASPTGFLWIRNDLVERITDH